MGHPTPVATCAWGEHDRLGASKIATDPIDLKNKPAKVTASRSFE